MDITILTVSFGKHGQSRSIILKCVYLPLVGIVRAASGLRSKWILIQAHDDTRTGVALFCGAGYWWKLVEIEVPRDTWSIITPAERATFGYPWCPITPRHFALGVVTWNVFSEPVVSSACERQLGEQGPSKIAFRLGFIKLRDQRSISDSILLNRDLTIQMKTRGVISKFEYRLCFLSQIWKLDFSKGDSGL